MKLSLLGWVTILSSTWLRKNFVDPDLKRQFFCFQSVYLEISQQIPIRMKILEEWDTRGIKYLTGCGDVSQSAPGQQLNSASNVAAFILKNFFV